MYRRHGSILIALVILGMLQAVPSSAVTILATGLSGNVYRIDPVTGVGAYIGPGFGGANSAAISPSGVLYTVGGGPDQLATVDPLTGIATPGPMLNMGGPVVGGATVRGLAFSPDGTLYAIQNGVDEYGRNVSDLLYTINLETGVGTLIGNTGDASLQSLAFGPDGRLYSWSLGRGLEMLDAMTGLATDVNPAIGESPDMQTIDFASDGTLYGVGGKLHEDSLYRIDPVTGTASLIGSGGYDDIRGIWAIGTVPEPGTAALLMVVIGPLLTRKFSQRCLRRG